MASHHKRIRMARAASRLSYSKDAITDSVLVHEPDHPESYPCSPMLEIQADHFLLLQFPSPALQAQERGHGLDLSFDGQTKRLMNLLLTGGP